MIALPVNIEGKWSEEIHDGYDHHHGRRNRGNEIEVSLFLIILCISHDHDIIHNDVRNYSLHEHEDRHHDRADERTNDLIMIYHYTADNIRYDINDCGKQKDMIHP